MDGVILRSDTYGVILRSDTYGVNDRLGSGC